MGTYNSIALTHQYNICSPSVSPILSPVESNYGEAFFCYKGPLNAKKEHGHLRVYRLCVNITNQLYKSTYQSQCRLQALV